MPRLIFRLFGLPRVELDGHPVVTDRRKALALLIYLSINGLEHTRETLATLLWPDQDTSHVLAYLRRTLWEINQTFGPGWVQTERDIVGLHPNAREQMWIDVTHFRALVAQSNTNEIDQDTASLLLKEAVDLYRDDFLAGFNLKDASLYEDWVQVQSESLRRDYLLSLETLARTQAKRRELDKAIETAVAWARRDPLNETAHGLLMELHFRNGHFNAAVRQYQECARVLMRELGVEISSDTKNLFERLKKDAEKRGAESANVEKPAPRSTLPESPYSTSFFGRRNELAELEKLIRDPKVRLISILGSGGAGKTRLALEAGRIHSTFFADGVCFVPLAAVSRPEYVVSSIATALDVHFEASDLHSQLDQLSGFLSSRQLLLILDNLEHLQVGSRIIHDLVDALLKAAPSLTILVTSHERLNLEQEWVLNVGGMPIPKPDSGDWEQYGAVQLFVQNVRKSAGILHLDEADRRAITHICQLVGGLPLGLELAAAWAKMLSCEEIAQEIERGMDFLKTPHKNVVERHQSLRATFEYSWNFLNETEQQVLMRLVVFRGGFKHEAAQSVADAPIAALSELVDKSLVQRDEAGRFDIHQALKPFVQEKLALHPDIQANTAAQHGVYFSAFTNEHRLALRGHNQRTALEELTTELDNILAGWGWAISQCSENDVQSYYEGLLRYFDLRNRFLDAVALFENATKQWEAHAGSENATYGVLLACHAWFCNRLSRISEAHSLLTQSLEHLRRLDARPQLMFANSLALYVVPMVDNMAEIERIAQESLAYYQEQNDRWGMAQVLPFFHRIKTPEGLKDAIRLHNQTLDIYRESGDSAGLASTLTSFGELLHYTGDYENARHCHQSSLDIARQLNDRRTIAASLDYLGFLNRQMGELDLSYRQHMESRDISQELGNALGVAGSLDNLGMVALDRHNIQEALNLFQQALPLRRASGQQGAVAISLEHIASASLQLGNLTLAEESIQEAISIFVHDPEWALTSRSMNRLGDLKMLQGHFSAARETYRNALEKAVEHDSITILLDTFLCFSALFSAEGDLALAIQYATFVENHPASEFALKEKAREKLSELQSKLDEADFEKAKETGRTISMEQITQRLH